MRFWLLLLSMEGLTNEKAAVGRRCSVWAWLVLPVRAQADNRTSRRLTCLDLMQGRYEADSYRYDKLRKVMGYLLNLLRQHDPENASNPQFVEALSSAIGEWCGESADNFNKPLDIEVLSTDVALKQTMQQH